MADASRWKAMSGRAPASRSRSRPTGSSSPARSRWRPDIRAETAELRLCPVFSAWVATAALVTAAPVSAFPLENIPDPRCHMALSKPCEPALRRREHNVHLVCGSPAGERSVEGKAMIRKVLFLCCRPCCRAGACRHAGRAARQAAGRRESVDADLEQRRVAARTDLALDGAGRHALVAHELQPARLRHRDRRAEPLRAGRHALRHGRSRPQPARRRGRNLRGEERRLQLQEPRRSRHRQDGAQSRLCELRRHVRLLHLPDRRDAEIAEPWHRSASLRPRRHRAAHDARRLQRQGKEDAHRLRGHRLRPVAVPDLDGWRQVLRPRRRDRLPARGLGKRRRGDEQGAGRSARQARARAICGDREDTRRARSRSGT